MVLITEAEASGALGLESLKITLREYWKARKTESFRLPTWSQDQAALAEHLALALFPTEDCWVQISDWAFDGVGHNDLFYGYRRGHGDTRLLIEASVYRFSPEDADRFSSIIGMVLYFGWDAQIFDSRLGYVINISNDEFIDLSTDSEPARESLTMVLSRFHSARKST
jgi:hypothetical protein